MIRSVRKSKGSFDDSTSLAGWVFADLLLSLSIIFLTSISFAVPSTNADQKVGNKDKGEVSSSLHLDEGFTISPLIDGFNFYYKEFNATKLKNDLAKYFKSKGMSADTEVMYAQIAGGYSEAKEGSEKGTLSALKFSIALKKANMSAFRNTSFDLLTSNQLPPGVVALRLTFVPAIQN